MLYETFIEENSMRITNVVCDSKFHLLLRQSFHFVLSACHGIVFIESVDCVILNGAISSCLHNLTSDVIQFTLCLHFHDY